MKPNPLDYGEIRIFNLKPEPTAWLELREGVLENFRILPTWGSTFPVDVLLSCAERILKTPAVKAVRFFDDLYERSSWCNAWFDHNLIEVRKALRGKSELEAKTVDCEILSRNEFSTVFAAEKPVNPIYFKLDDNYRGKTWDSLIAILKHPNMDACDVEFLIFKYRGRLAGAGALVVPQGSNVAYWHFYETFVEETVTFPDLALTALNRLKQTKKAEFLDLWNVSDTPYDEWKKPFFTNETKGWCWSRGYQKLFPWAHEDLDRG